MAAGRRASSKGGLGEVECDEPERSCGELDKYFHGEGRRMAERVPSCVLLGQA
jgi:hypothetical protein